MKKTAFSLTEIVIVVVILGIVMAGIVASQDIIAEAKLRTARSVTQTSNVRSMDGIALWLESTSEESFDADVDSTSTTDNKVDNWYDITPDAEKAVRNNPSQAIAANQPSLVTNAINGLPAVMFNGSTTYLEAAYAAKLNPSNYSSFAVVEASPITGYGSIFTSRDTGKGYNLYVTPTATYEAWNGSSGWITSGAGSRVNFGNPDILSTTFNGSSLNLYQNGSLKEAKAATIVLNTSKTLRVGSGYTESVTPTYYYSGYIGEIIIFNRAVTTDERKVIEAYLSKKWGIKVAG